MTGARRVRNGPYRRRGEGEPFGVPSLRTPATAPVSLFSTSRLPLLRGNRRASPRWHPRARERRRLDVVPRRDARCSTSTDRRSRMVQTLLTVCSPHRSPPPHSGLRMHPRPTAVCGLIAGRSSSQTESIRHLQEHRSDTSDPLQGGDHAAHRVRVRCLHQAEGTAARSCRATGEAAAGLRGTRRGS